MQMDYCWPDNDPAPTPPTTDALAAAVERLTNRRGHLQVSLDSLIRRDAPKGHDDAAIQKLRAEIAEADALLAAARVAGAVAALHVEQQFGPNDRDMATDEPLFGGAGFCAGCGNEWPCGTHRAALRAAGGTTT